MSYTPTNWQTGDTVTAEKLNKMESGIAAAAADPFIVTFTPTAQDFSGITDKSNAEVYEAFLAGKQIICRIISGETSINAPAFVTVFDNNGRFSARVVTFGLSNNLLIYFQQVVSGELQAPYVTNIYQLTPMS